jgi:hypothetical protein
MDEILRKPTESEKAEMSNLMDKNETPERVFRKKNVKKQQEHTEKGTPYCYTCAKLDFEKKLVDVKEKVQNGIKVGEKDLEFDFKPYEDVKRFDKIKTNKQSTQVQVGISTQTLETFYDVFQCKVRGCKVSIKQTPKKKEEKK